MIGLMEVNAFETNLTADWKKKPMDEEAENGADEGKERAPEEKEDGTPGGRVRERDGWGRGVFPLLAMLNHNCGSNARFLSFTAGFPEIFFGGGYKIPFDCN